MTSQMTRDVMARLSCDETPPTLPTHSSASTLRSDVLHASPALVDGTSSITANRSIDTKPLLSQSWVELTPTPSHSQSSVKQVKGKFGGTKMTPKHDGVVYAHVSPLSYSEHSVSGKGSTNEQVTSGKASKIKASQSSPSLPMISRASAGKNNLVTSLSTSQLEGVASSLHGPRPPPISKARLPPPIPQSSLASKTSLSTAAINKLAGDTQPLTNVSQVGQSVNDSSLLPGALPNSMQSRTPGASDHKAHYVPLDCVTQEMPALQKMTADTDFDVAGLLQSLQQLENLRLEAANSIISQGISSSEGKGLVSADGGVTEHVQPLSACSSQSSIHNSLATQLTVSNTSRQQQHIHLPQQPAVSPSQGGLLLAPVHQTMAGKEAESMRGCYKALTPITEEGSTLTSSFIEEEAGDKGVPVVTDVVRNKSSLLPVSSRTKLTTGDRPSPDDKTLLPPKLGLTGSPKLYNRNPSGVVEAESSMGGIVLKHRGDRKAGESVPDTWFSLSAHLTQ